MTSPSKPGFMLPVAVTLAVLLGLYLGAYYVMVKPVSIEDADIWNLPPWGRPPPRRIIAIRPSYLLAGGKGWTLFAPIHWLDRRIRPHVWEPEPDWKAIFGQTELPPDTPPPSYRGVIRVRRE